MNVKNLRLTQVFSGFRKAERTAPIQNLRAPSGIFVEGKVYRAWTWTLPLLLGLASGWFGMTCLGVWLDAGIRPQRPVAVPAADVSLISGTEMMNMNSFLSINPFRISPMPFQNDEDAYTPEGEGEVPITGDLATAVLKWPMTDVGVWIESQGKLHLVLIDESFDVYTLEKVSYRQAFFSRGDERVVKDLLFAAPVPGKTVASLPADRSSAPAAMGGQVSAAEAGGKEGTISSELVLRLMENPFDELKNVRLRPKDGEQGLQIQWINKDSILSQLGVRKGDLIRSINGIPFRNMADITNSMNSLMSSERFDVEVVRDGAPTSLKYVVR